MTFDPKSKFMHSFKGSIYSWMNKKLKENIPKLFFFTNKFVNRGILM